MNNVPNRPSLFSVQSDDREQTQKQQSIVFRLQNFKTININKEREEANGYKDFSDIYGSEYVHSKEDDKHIW